MSTVIKEVSKVRCCGGWQKVFCHDSVELQCKMNFAIYLPETSEKEKVPAIYWLSGLTCTEQNFIAKAGAQRLAQEHGVAVVAPDTSPRGCNIDGEDESWDFGSSAGFYVDATEAKWKKNYRMYSYVTKELTSLVDANFPVDGRRRSIMGHSMGGHGALVMFLRNEGMFRSVSAFAPICNPMRCPWGQKAFTGYIGTDENAWKEYDACELVKKSKNITSSILIDQGKEDGFLPAGQLLPDNFVAACATAKVPLKLEIHEGYDHSYYFISTFIGRHFAHHARYLKA